MALLGSGFHKKAGSNSTWDDLPVAAFFVSVSAFLLPGTPLCADIHLMLALYCTPELPQQCLMSVYTNNQGGAQSNQCAARGVSWIPDIGDGWTDDCLEGEKAGLCQDVVSLFSYMKFTYGCPSGYVIDCHCQGLNTPIH